MEKTNNVEIKEKEQSPRDSALALVTCLFPVI